MLTIEPRGSGRRGCVLGVIGAAVVGIDGVGVPGVPAAGALSWAKTARAASRAAAVWAGLRVGRAAVVGLDAEPERACRSDWDGVICIMIKFYSNAAKISLIADLPLRRRGNNTFCPGVYAAALICGAGDVGCTRGGSAGGVEGRWGRGGA